MLTGSPIWLSDSPIRLSDCLAMVSAYQMALETYKGCQMALSGGGLDGPIRHSEDPRPTRLSDGPSGSHMTLQCSQRALSGSEMALSGTWEDPIRRSDGPIRLSDDSTMLSEGPVKFTDGPMRLSEYPRRLSDAL